MGNHIYLAGPITGLTYDQGQDWREYAAGMLMRTFGIETRSPLRAKEYLKTFGVLESQYLGVNPLSEPKGIVTRDRNDCTSAGVVLANFLGAERISIGTVMECAWADLARVPIVAVMELENTHRHGMLTEVAGYIVESLEQGLAICVTILNRERV